MMGQEDGFAIAFQSSHMFVTSKEAHVSQSKMVVSSASATSCSIQQSLKAAPYIFICYGVKSWQGKSPRRPQKDARRSLA